MFESTQIIGRKQYNKAKQLFDSATEELVGPIDYRLKYVDMTDLDVTLANGTKVIFLLSKICNYFSIVFKMIVMIIQWVKSLHY